MKLNEKHLAAFASSSSPCDKEGYLQKRGEMNKAFQKRWFVLKGNMLFYFEKRGDKEPIGVIILEGCTVELSEGEGVDTFSFELVFQGSGTRTYILAAETQEEMESWMKAIACAGYEYMKLMVAELQRQLDEINMAQNNVGPGSWNPARGKSTTPPKQNPSEAQLVDLTVPDSGQSTNRANPFDSGKGSTFEKYGTASYRPPTHRTFEEMHREFGAFIQQKMQEAARQNSARLQASASGGSS